MGTIYFSTLRDAGFWDRVGFSPLRWIAYGELVLQVRRERQALRRLGAWQVADLGLDPGAVARESGRGLFDIPKSRLGELD